jgi:hypothetical protein
MIIILMKIICIKNSKESLPASILGRYKLSYEILPLVEGKEYVIYALRVYLGHIWYCLCDEHFTFYPNWYPWMLFEVIDTRLSRHWVFGYEEDEYGRTPYLSFPEWASDRRFYEDLVDGNKMGKCALVFKEYRERMNVEFPDSAVTRSAQVGDAAWLICPQCLDAWPASGSRDALVRCPKCQQVWCDPRYQNTLDR